MFEKSTKVGSPLRHPQCVSCSYHTLMRRTLTSLTSAYIPRWPLQRHQRAIPAQLQPCLPVPEQVTRPCFFRIGVAMTRHCPNMPEEVRHASPEPLCKTISRGTNSLYRAHVPYLPDLSSMSSHAIAHATAVAANTDSDKNVCVL